jgi:hypothetical protein
MRLALLVSIPTACALFFYVVTGILFIAGYAFVTAFLAVLEWTPEPKEVRRTLKRKMDAPDGTMIWYMIEEKATGNVRLYK